MAQMDIQPKRVYSPVEKEDGLRVLVDRVWPRGMTKIRVHADLWLKDAAPSTVLRKWFNHDRSKWEKFKDRYFSELDLNPQVIQQFLELSGKGRLTLLYSAHDEQCNQAVALKEYLLSMAKKGRTLAGHNSKK